MTDSNGMSTDHAKTCAKDRGRDELGERKNKVAHVAKPGTGRAEGDAARERGPEHAGPTLTGPLGACWTRGVCMLTSLPASRMHDTV